MRRTLVAVIFFAAFSAHSAPRITVGSGVEARLQSEVNPDYNDTQAVPQLFLQTRFEPTAWLAQLEVGYERESSEAGGLRVRTTSTNLAAWGRYEFIPERRWHPYLAGGVGAYFDRITTQFGSAIDERNGLRKFWGFGAGLSAVYWENLLVEFEGRAVLVEDRAEPTFSGLFRLGVQI